MDVIGIRGAIRAAGNDREEILDATRRLLLEIERRNLFDRSDVVSAFFTMTPDLDAAFPAQAARALGWSDVPMLGAREVAVPEAPDRMIRVLLHVRGAGPARHVYLGEAAALRPDLAEGGGAEPTGEAPAMTSGSRAPEATPGTPRPVGPPRSAASGTLLVVGLGLIGGSLALAVRRTGAFARVLGVDADPGALDLGRARGAIEAGGTDAAALLGEADVVLLAIPTLAAVAWLREHGPRLRAGQVVLDVASTKRGILEEMDRLPPGVEAIGAHPMGGSERSGMAAARPDLLRGVAWALVRGRRTGPRVEAAAHALLEASGGTAVGVDAERHDAAVAATSHLPYLLSAALALHVAGRADDGVLRMLAGPGLRDTTRLAGSRPELMAEIVRANRENVRREVRGYLRRLESLLGELERAPDGEVAAVLGRAVAAREALFPGA